eukprot:6143954-Amphidinium_carterae.1
MQWGCIKDVRNGDATTQPCNRSVASKGDATVQLWGCIIQAGRLNRLKFEANCFAFCAGYTAFFGPIYEGVGAILMYGYIPSPCLHCKGSSF